jgi:hypothetical protein
MAADNLTPSDQPAVDSRDEIAHRAYELYLERGSEPGYELDDWLRAERELLDDRR